MVKRTCKGCRGLTCTVKNQYGRFNMLPRCYLGYKTETVEIKHSALAYTCEVKPLEECPKPKTWKEFQEIVDEYFAKNREKDFDESIWD